MADSRPTLRIVASADWHFPGRVDAPTLRRLLASMAAVKPDLLLVLGDFVDWHKPRMLRYVFAGLGEVGLPVAVVFGNHDVWLGSAPGLQSSWDAVESFCNLAAEAGLHPLDRDPLRLGDLFICGTGGWYDYSLGAPYWSEQQYTTKRYAGLVNQDGSYARWGTADPEVCRTLLDELEARLRLVPEGCEPIVATHVVALPDSLRWGDPVWDFFNAYWGSRRLGDLLGRVGVRLHLHGHVHADGVRIPDMAADRSSNLVSYNACFYGDRPFLICDRDDSEQGWHVRAGTL